MFYAPKDIMNLFIKQMKKTPQNLLSLWQNGLITTKVMGNVYFYLLMA